jgi:uncharacterized damage-inducible protein DinB
MGFLTQTRQLLLYTLWADRTMLNALREVTPEDLTRDAGVSFGSLLGTMIHILGSQRRWLARLAGGPVQPSPGLADFPDLRSWILGWEETAAGIEAFLASLTEDQLMAEITWEDTEIGPVTRPLWQPVSHMVNHSTYHRGQVMSLMRQLGYQPPKTDLIHFFLK